MANFNPVCGVCESRQKSTLAKVWCSECDEGLCKKCSKHHRAGRISRKHITVPITEYLVLPEFVKSIKQVCEEHNERFSLYCNNHSSPCCRSCVSDIHRSCTRIDKIEQVTCNAKSSIAFSEIEDTLADITETVTLLIRDREDNLESIKNERNKIQKNIYEMRLRINQHLDRIQAETLKDLTAAEEKECLKIQSVMTSLSDRKKELSQYKKDIAGIRNHASNIQAFLGVSHLKKTVHDTSQIIKQVLTKEDVDTISLNFWADLSMQKVIFSRKTFGDTNIDHKRCTTKIVDRKEKNAQVKISRPVDEISLKLNQTIDTEGRDVCGCVLLSDGRMAFPCYRKSTVSVFDRTGKCQFKTKLAMSPLDITVSEDTGTIFVSVAGNKNIVQLNVDNEETTIISCNTYNYGVVSRGNKLIYCAQYIGVCEMNPSDGSVKVIFREHLPSHCYVVEFQDKIYYSNFKINTVTCCGKDGKQLWRFKDESLKNPMGIDIDNFGNVYVVGYNTHSIIVISPDCKRYKEILSKKDGLDLPTALHYQRTTNKLLITNEKDKAFLFDVVHSSM